MGRAETYIVDAVTVLLSWLLSAFGRQFVRLLRRGWIQGRINSLNSDAIQIETMRVHLPFLISHIGFMMFRVLFLVGLMILSEPNHPFVASGVFGVMVGEIGRTLTSINRLNSYDTYMPQTKLKIEKLKNRLAAKSTISSHA